MNNADLDNLISEIQKYSEYNDKYKNKLMKLIGDLKELKELKEQELYITFVAGKGKGKTTLINNLLGLTYNDVKKKKNGTNVNVKKEILTTGSGATTTSEVEIIQSENDKNFIEIIPYENQEIKNFISEFCKRVYKEVFVEFKGNGIIPSEFERAIRNMTNLREQNDIKNDIHFDPAKEIAKTFVDNYYGFESEIIKRAKLEERINLKFEFENNKVSIRNTFKNINLMKIENTPLPRKIILKITKNIFNFSELGNVKGVIDTRGLESDIISSDRKDIRSLFMDERNKIIVLVDEFKDQTKSLMKLIDDYVDNMNGEVSSRIIYVVNFKDGEPEAVVGYDGEYDNEADGILYKKNHLIKYMNSNNINILTDNIIYFNPKRYIDKNGAIEVDVDDIQDYGSKEEAINQKENIKAIERNEFIKNISQAIKRRTDYIENKISIKEQEFRDIKSREFDNLKLNKFKLREKIIFFSSEEKNNLNFKDGFDTLFEEYILDTHPSTLMAINNRGGIYYNRDIFSVGAKEVESLFNKITIKICNYTLRYILNEFDLKSGEKIKNYIIDDMTKHYRKAGKKVYDYFYSYLKNKVYNKEVNVIFWADVIMRWGQDPGYIRDINYRYKQELVKNDIKEIILNYVENELGKFSYELISIIDEILF